MTEFSISPQLFFLIGLSAAVCLEAALFAVKSSSGFEFRARREIVKWIFVLYLLLVISLSLFPVEYYIGIPVFRPAQINLIPFKSIIRTAGVFRISRFSLYFKLGAAFRNIVGNLLLFFPLGFMLPRLDRRFRSKASCFFTSLAASLAIELGQFVESSFGFALDRAADIDGVILNVAGALLGFYVWRRLYERYCL